MYEISKCFRGNMYEISKCFWRITQSSKGLAEEVVMALKLP